MQNLKTSALTFIVMYGATFSAFGQPLFRIIEAPPPPSNYPVVESVNVRGISGNGNVVVGCATYKTSSGPTQRQTLAFKWTLVDGPQSLGDLMGGDVNSCAYGASMDGSVIVGEGTSYPETREAVRWINGAIEGLGDIQAGLPASSATAISEDGNIIVGQGFHQAFKWDDGVMIGLGNLPDGQDSAATGVSADGFLVVGSSYNSSGNSEAVRWSNGEIQTFLPYPPESTISVATDVSADGEIIVGYTSSSKTFVWSKSSILEISYTVSPHISGDGRTVVGQLGGSAVIWDTANGLRDLNAILEDDLGLYLGTWKLFLATAISFDGVTVAGQANRGSDNVTRGFFTRLGSINTSDSDGDGVPDSLDVCEATIPNVLIDSAGCPPQFPLDLDRDGDADLADLAIMQRCWSGPDNLIDPACWKPE